MTAMLTTVVVWPAINGNAPHIPQPVSPRKKSLKDSCLNFFFFFIISLKKNGIKITNTVSHLQNASETGGTNGTAPLAMAKLLAIKIGCIKSKINGKKDVLFFLEEGFINHHAYYQAHKNINRQNIFKTNHHWSS